MVQPKKKKIDGMVTGLIAVAILAVLVFGAVLLARGAYLASRMASQPKANTIIPSGLEVVPTISTLPSSPTSQPLQTQIGSLVILLRQNPPSKALMDSPRISQYYWTTMGI